MRTRWLVLLWCVAAVYLGWWVGHNPLPDGYQNEYLHVGNAFDLWGALVHLDEWHLRWYMYTGYWPWGYYAVPWPFLAFTGPSRMALVAGNLVHLAVLLWGANELGRRLDAPLAPVVLLLCPGVFGTLVRFEPNLADIAWTVAGAAFLLRSEGLGRRREVLGWGACLGLGLMMDRLAVGLFLGPAALPLVVGADRRAWRNLAWGVGLALVLTVAWYREFFLRNWAEIAGQVDVGEVDSAGAVTVTGGTWPWLYYPLSLVDSQAGPIIGALMLWGAGAAAVALLGRRGAWRTQAVLLAAVVPALVFFTFIAKKQVFYTLPILGPLAVLATMRRRVASWLAVGGGLWSFASVGLGLVPGGPWLPEELVSPRHTLARPPSFQQWPLAKADAALAPPPRAIAVFSSDPTLYEGFVILHFREAFPHATVRGVVLDPIGTFEDFDRVDALVTVEPPGRGWPDVPTIERELLDDHYDLAKIPDVAGRVARQADRFTAVGRWPAGEAEVVAYRRK